MEIYTIGNKLNWTAAKYHCVNNRNRALSESRGNMYLLRRNARLILTHVTERELYCLLIYFIYKRRASILRTRVVRMSALSLSYEDFFFL